MCINYKIMTVCFVPHACLCQGNYYIFLECGSIQTTLNV